MNKAEYLETICSKCKKCICNNEVKKDKEHRCEKLKKVAIAWDTAVESAIEFLEEEVGTRYEYYERDAEEIGIDADVKNKWEFIDKFRNAIS